MKEACFKNLLWSRSSIKELLTERVSQRIDMYLSIGLTSEQYNTLKGYTKKIPRLLKPNMFKALQHTSSICKLGLALTTGKTIVILVTNVSNNCIIDLFIA